VGPRRLCRTDRTCVPHQLHTAGHPKWRFSAVFLVLAASFLPAALTYVKRYSIPLSSAASIYCCFLVLLFYLLAPAMHAGRTLLAKVIERRYKSIIVLGLLVVPYLVYALGTRDFHWSALGQIFGIAAPVIGVYSGFPVRDRTKFNWQDMFAAIWMVSVVLFHLFKGIWNVPVHFDFMARLFMVSLGVFCWTYIRVVPCLEYRLVFSPKALLAAATNFAFFAAIAIPLGLVLRFTSWNPRWHGVLDFALAYIQILLFVAVLEELFFRGFLQNLLENSFRAWWLGQLIASCIFGLFHILHSPFPNWRYVIMASIAGWFYGSSYRSGGTLLSSALLHTAVDTVWRTFFTKG
jgi:uncharacterized protein